jgi:hypothetical protein
VSAPRQNSECCSSGVPVYKSVYSLAFRQVIAQNVSTLYAVSSDKTDRHYNSSTDMAFTVYFHVLNTATENFIILYDSLGN